LLGVSATQLAKRVDELEGSRAGVVDAAEAERTRIERDLHDGAQQHLVALRTRLALAERLTERDPGKAEEMIANLEQQAGEALDTPAELKALARRALASGEIQVSDVYGYGGPSPAPRRSSATSSGALHPPVRHELRRAADCTGNCFASPGWGEAHRPAITDAG